MKKMYILIIFVLYFPLISCSRVEIVSDPYWNTLVSEFQGSAAGIKFQSFINGYKLILTTGNAAVEAIKLDDIINTGSNVYLLSPLYSKNVSSLEVDDTDSVFYYFGRIDESAADGNDNIFVVERDRRKAFFDAGILLSKEIDNNSVISIIFDVDNVVRKEETYSFLDGIEKSGKNINIVSMEVKSTTNEGEIRKFFERESVYKDTYMVIFTEKWKNICFELSERDGKQIITSDSWFSKTYKPLIAVSIEDNIKGMLKSVYKNIKSGKHTDIILDGVINK